MAWKLVESVVKEPGKVWKSKMLIKFLELMVCFLSVILQLVMG